MNMRAYSVQICHWHGFQSTHVYIARHEPGESGFCSHTYYPREASLRRLSVAINNVKSKACLCLLADEIIVSYLDFVSLCDKPEVVLAG